MSFAESKMDEAVSLLKASKVGAGGKDKRRAPRREIRAVTTVVITKEFKAELRDLSARGASLVFDEWLESGSQFSLHLPAKPRTVRRPVICQVVRCRPQADGKFLLGVEFIGSSEDRHASEADDSTQAERIRQSILR